METTNIQKFGHLIVLDLNLKIVGISSSILDRVALKAENLLQSSALEVFPKLLKTQSDFKKVIKILENFVKENPPRSLITVKILQKSYYLKITKVNSFIYIEAEQQYRKHISSSELNDIGFLFENKYNTQWDLVCKALNNIIHFDRVFVLQVQDTGNCNVIAEYNNGNVEDFKHKQFAKEYMPEEVIQHHQDSPYRYIPNMEADFEEFYSIKDNIDINFTQTVCPPEIKLKYFNFIHVKSSLSFPLFLQGKFWGLVIAHNMQKTHVDLQQRKICTFIVQNAMSKYETFIKQGLLDINLQVQNFQNILLDRLARHKTINCALVESMDSLQNMLKADGLAIYNEGEVYFKGHTPSTDLFLEIVAYLKANEKRTIFKDHNFKRNQKQNFSTELPFAGILAYNIDSKSDHYIIWFRNQTVIVETQLEYNDSLPYGIQSIEKKIHDSALPWNDAELNLLTGLQNTLNHSMKQKLLENKDLAKNLAELNNELEMFTYSLSHDLKNPLSVLKMGIDFLKSKNGNIDDRQKEKWFSTISLGLQNIQDIIDNIITVSHDKVKKIAKDSIPLQFLVRKIAEESKLAYQDVNCEITYGNLLPIWGEKSAAYQIFTNVISNAIKYSQYSASPKIHIESVIMDKWIQYKISDNGIGIPAQDLTHIFEMFTRAKNVDNYNGSGIGLSLVKRIIERLDGEIEIQSEEGKGTTVIMHFPLEKELPQVMMDATATE